MFFLLQFSVVGEGEGEGEGGGEEWRGERGRGVLALQIG